MNLNKTLKVSISIQGYTKKPQGKEVAQIHYLKQTVTIQQLIDYISQGHCITHCFEDYDEEFGQSTKKIENFRYTQLIGIDVDDSDVDLDTYISSLVYKPTIAYTTFSHNIKGNRYRLIYIFNQKIKGAELYCNVYKWLTQDLNLKDNCMQSCAQQMYGTTKDAQWYVSDTTYDIPTECKTTYGQQCKIKVSKASTQKQLPKTSQKVQSEYNNREEVHYIGNAINEENDTFSDNAVVKALYSMSPQDFIFYYHNTFEYFISTPLHYEDGYALIPEDYYEIKRPWYKDKVGDKTITVVKTIRDGEQRRKRLCNTAIILRAIKRDISFEHLLYILVCERQYYYDNQDKALSNKELINIAKWAIELPSEQINPKKVKHPKFKVDKSYWAEKGITARQAANIVRGIIKEQEIGSVYDFNLTDKENLAMMKEYGIKVSQRSLTNFKRKYKINYPKTVKTKVSKASTQNFTKSSNPNIIEEENTLYSNCQFTEENGHLLLEEHKNKKHNKARKMKQDIIKDYYNPQLTDEQNVKLMNENGIKVSINTLRRWRKSNGIQREIGGDHCSQEYKSKKQLPISEASTQNQSVKSKYPKSSSQNQVFKQNEYLKSSVQNQVIKSEIKCSESSSQNEEQVVKTNEIKVSKPLNQSAILEKQSEEIKVQKQSESLVPKCKNQSAKIENDTFDHLEKLEENNIDLNKIPSSITDEKTLQLYANAYLKEMSTAKAWPAYTRNREKYNKVMKNASSSIKSDVIDNIRGKYKTIETDRIEWIGIHVASILPYDSAYDELYNQGYLPKNSNMYWQQYFKKNNAVCEAV